MNLPELHLLRPAWLLLLIPLVLGLWRLARNNPGAAAWRQVVDAHLLPHLLVATEGRVKKLPLLLLALGGLLGSIALAGPVWERLPQPAYQTQSERVIVLDISSAMNATDLPPSRLAHARFEILDLLDRFKEGQTALIAYGAEPFVVSPLTADTNTIAAQVPSLSTELLPVQGPKRTDLALEEAGRLLSQAGSAHGEVILLTDGLKHPAAALDAARALDEQGYRLSVLGVGTAAGAPVPASGGGFLKGADGAILMPKLDTAALRSLASAGGGRYITASLDDRDIKALADSAPRERRQIDGETALADQWREEGPWLLLALLPLAAVAFRRGWISPLLLVVLLVPPPPAEAFSWSELWLRPDQQGAQLLEQGAAQDAAQTFQRPDWRAAAAYEAGDYAEALKSLEGTDNPNAWYNQGNTLARLGSLEEAIAAYERTLAANPDDADARHNRDLVKQLLEQQQQEQEQQGQSGSPEATNTQDGAEQEQQQSDTQNRTGQANHQGGSSSSSSGQSANDTDQAAEQHEQGSEQDGRSAAPKNAQTESQSTQGSTGEPEEDSKQAGKTGPDQGKETPASPPQAAAAGTETGTEPVDAARSGERQTTLGQDRAESAASDNQSAPSGAEPGLADLLENPRRPGAQTQSADAALPVPMTEAQQAMEHQLNRVPDDPAGLLRQRFLLQHLRRTGQL